MQLFARGTITSDIEEADAVFEFMSDVARTGEHIVVTKDGKPLVEIVPAVSAGKQPVDIFGCMRGQITIHGDLDDARR